MTCLLSHRLHQPPPPFFLYVLCTHQSQRCVSAHVPFCVFVLYPSASHSLFPTTWSQWHHAAQPITTSYKQHGVLMVCSCSCCCCSLPPPPPPLCLSSTCDAIKHTTVLCALQNITHTHARARMGSTLGCYESKRHMSGVMTMAK